MTYIFATEQPLTVRHLQKWRINKHGYDSIGSYWGAGVPVWTYELYFPSGRKLYASEAVRARTKTEAKRKIKERFPAVKKFVLND
jgi:hypothetical protein